MSAPETFAYWGLVALDRFEQLTPEEQTEAIAFGERLKTLSEHELFSECKEHIWTDAVLSSRGRYSILSDLHCAMCVVESNKRAPEGVRPYSAETIYARAHKACMAEAGV